MGTEIKAAVSTMNIKLAKYHSLLVNEHLHSFPSLNKRKWGIVELKRERKTVQLLRFVEISVESQKSHM